MAEGDVNRLEANNCLGGESRSFRDLLAGTGAQIDDALAASVAAGDFSQVPWSGPKDSDETLLEAVASIARDGGSARSWLALGFRLREHVLRGGKIMSSRLENQLARALDRPARKDESLGIYYCYAALFTTSAHAARWDRAVAYAERAVFWADRSDVRVARARARRMLAHGLADSGQVGRAAGVYVDALDDAPDRVAIEILGNLAQLLSGIGLPRQALVVAKRAHALFEYTGDRRFNTRMVLVGQITNGYWLLGDVRRGLAMAEEAVAIAREIGRREPATSVNRGHAVVANINLAWLCLESDQLERAREALDAADALIAVQESGSVLGTFGSWAGVLATIARGLLLVRSGEAAAGLSMIEQALGRLEREPRAMSMLEVLLVAARAYQVAGLKAQGSDHMSRAMRLVVGYRGQLAGLPSDEVRQVAHFNRVAPVHEIETAESRARRRLIDMAVLAELPEFEDGLHVFRVGRLSEELAIAVGCGAEEALAIRAAGMLHDIGKLGLPQDLEYRALCGDADAAEASEEHVNLGSALLSGLGVKYARAVEAARSHHEHWDGTGYPSQLAGESIPLAARIVAIAETYDDFSHSKRFGPPLSGELALERLRRDSGRRFDPALVALFGECIRNQPSTLNEGDGELLDAAARESDVISLKSRVDGSLSKLDEREADGGEREQGGSGRITLLPVNEHASRERLHGATNEKLAADQLVGSKALPADKCG